LFGPVVAARHVAPVQEVFADVSRSAKPVSLRLNRPVRHTAAPHRRTEHHRTEQAQLAMTFSTGINMVHKEWAPVRFATAILGAMNTSRLFTVVRERHGLAYSVGAFLIGQTGLIAMHAGTEGSKLSSARKLMLGELSRLADEGVTDEEFTMARQWLTDITLASQDSLAARLDGHASYQSCGHIVPVEENIRRLERVTPDQIRKAAARMRPLAEVAIRPK
jgi:riboflavin kinase/FMN adenylyltransferase